MNEIEVKQFVGELTLTIMQLNKQIQQLQAEIAELKKNGN